MNGRGRRAGPLADWVVLGAAALFMAAGMLTVRYPETAILRLAAFGLPAWPAYVAGIVEMVAGALLLHGRARPWAAVVLIAVSLAALSLNFAYREPRSALEALGLMVLAVVVVLLEKKRS